MKKEENKNKEVDYMITSIAAAGFGALAFPYTAAIGACCMAAGGASLAFQLYGPIKRLLGTRGIYAEEVGKIIDIIKINEVKNKNDDPLTVEKVNITSNGFDVEFKVPLGLSYKDIDGIMPAISASIGGKKVVRDSNKISIKFSELKESYELLFMPIPREKRNRLITYIGNYIEGILDLNLSQAGGILLAGQTGSGKSTVLRYILTHIAVNYKEDEINLYLNDMKFSELMLFKNLKITKWHNTDPDCVMISLQKFWGEVRNRYKLFEENNCIDAYDYEAKTGKKVPINLMVIEEFTILSGKKYSAEIDLLNNILSQCRASKSHVIITTQRPDAKTLDPRLKANITHTIGLKTKSVINSQIICDEDYLKYLRGNGHGYLFDNRGDFEFQAFNLSPDIAKKMLEPYNRSEEEMKKIKGEKIYISVGFDECSEDGDEF